MQSMARMKAIKDMRRGRMAGKLGRILVVVWGGILCTAGSLDEVVGEFCRLKMAIATEVARPAWE